MAETSPTARALRALELLQNQPGITAAELADALAVTERAARRYVAILRQAEIPIRAVPGPGGGYTVGRGIRLPPLMFSATEALGVVMAVLESHDASADDPVGTALRKIMRARWEVVRFLGRTPAVLADRSQAEERVAAWTAFDGALHGVLAIVRSG